MLSTDPFAKGLKYSIVGSSKIYTFDEYVEEIEKMIQSLNNVHEPRNAEFTAFLGSFLVA